jgi:hypothetical protein
VKPGQINLPMKYLKSFLAVLLLSLAVTGEAGGGGSRCAASDKPMLQIPGSGGPIAGDDRAPTGYLLWTDDRAW